MTQKKVHAFFSGHVQGVGFRATAYRLAELNPITGFVRNLPDGRVELLAEGEEEVLSDFMQKVRKSFLNQYIRGVEMNWYESQPEYKDFSISYI
jgi:acylphosphatase